MASPWIKMRVDLAVCPQVVRIASALGADGLRHTMRAAIAVGLLHRTWSLADGQTEDGWLPGYTREALDEIIGVPGWCNILESVGWMAVEASGLRIPGFEEHNGASAKRRGKESLRKADVRNLSASRADAERPSSSSSSISSSSSGSGSESDAPARKRAKNAACTLDEHLAEFEFAGLRADVIEDARRWSAYRRGRKPRTAPWGPAQWRPALRDAIKDPAAFRAAVEHSVRQGYQGLIPASPASAPQERLTAHEQARRRHDSAIESIRNGNALAGLPGALDAKRQIETTRR